MPSDDISIQRQGGCLCGAVRFRVTGGPLRAGICHCADCRKTSGSMFAAFGIWPRDAFEMTGDVGTYSGRSFCLTCGSRVVSCREDEAEVMLGSLDWTPTDDLAPQYELWVQRRAHWLGPLSGMEQHEGDRPSEAAIDLPAEALPPPEPGPDSKPVSLPEPQPPV